MVCPDTDTLAAVAGDEAEAKRNPEAAQSRSQSLPQLSGNANPLAALIVEHLWLTCKCKRFLSRESLPPTGRQGGIPLRLFDGAYSPGTYYIGICVWFCHLLMQIFITLRAFFFGIFVDNSAGFRGVGGYPTPL